MIRVAMTTRLVRAVGWLSGRARYHCGPGHAETHNDNRKDLPRLPNLDRLVDRQ